MFIGQIQISPTPLPCLDQRNKHLTREYSTETHHHGKMGLSPAQKLYGQPVQDTLPPAHRRAFSLEWQCSTSVAEKQAQITRETVETTYNGKAQSLPEIRNGLSFPPPPPPLSLQHSFTS